MVNVDEMRPLRQGADAIVKVVRFVDELWSNLETWMTKKVFHEKRTVSGLQVRRKATNKAMFVGLKHFGIVSTFAIMSDTPTTLVCDHYNDGPLRYALGIIRKHSNLCKLSEDGLEMVKANRMGFLYVVMETMEFVHGLH